MCKPMVSVIIVNFNASSRLLRCVESLFRENAISIECIVVDNGSSDNSVQKLQETFKDDSRLSVIELATNYGPAYARNCGIERACGEYVAFLDNDTVVTPNWLATPLQRMQEDESIGACQCKLVLLDDPNRIDYVGDYLGSFGFLVLRAPSGSLDAGLWDVEAEIFSAKSAAMVARREAVVRAGLFDPDYFIYVEETDLGWRIWLEGYRIIYCPGSVVRHEYSSSRDVLGRNKQTHFVKFHGCKNYVLTLIKNAGPLRLIQLLPLHIVMWLGLACFELFRGRVRNAGWIISGLWWNVRHLRKTLHKRRHIQSKRKQRDRDIWNHIYRRVSLSYYLKKLCVVPETGHAEGL